MNLERTEVGNHFDSVGSWIDRLNLIINSPSVIDISHCIRQVNTILHDPGPTGLPRFLWETYGYAHGNYYISNSRGEFLCLHRDRSLDWEANRNEFIRLPWVRHDNPSESTSLSAVDGAGSGQDRFAIYSETERDRIDLSSPSPIPHERTSYLCHDWLKTHTSFSRMLVEEGEMVFFRLFVDQSYNPTDVHFESMRMWLVERAAIARLVAGELVPNNLDDFLGSEDSRQKWVRDLDRQVLAKKLTRCNPITDMDRFRTRNMLFFPSGRIVAARPGRDDSSLLQVYCLVSFSKLESLVSREDCQRELCWLFSVIGAAGVSLGQQRINQRLLVDERLVSGRHTFRTKNAITLSHLSQLKKEMCPACIEKSAQSLSVLKTEAKRILKHSEILSHLRDRAGGCSKHLERQIFSPASMLHDLLMESPDFLQAVLLQDRVESNLRRIPYLCQPDGRLSTECVRRSAVRLELPSPKCFISGDTDVFQAIIELLTENAFQHAQFHELAVVTFAIARTGEDLTLTVKNPAASEILQWFQHFLDQGFHPAELPREHFFSGSGLGLIDFYASLLSGRKESLAINIDRLAGSISFDVNLGTCIDATEGRMP